MAFRATIRQAKELLETGKASHFIARCSTSISKDGKVKATAVSSDWWITCPEVGGIFGSKFSATPNEIVTVFE